MPATQATGFRMFPPTNGGQGVICFRSFLLPTLDPSFAEHRGHPRVARYGCTTHTDSIISKSTKRTITSEHRILTPTVSQGSHKLTTARYQHQSRAGTTKTQSFTAVNEYAMDTMQDLTTCAAAA